MTRERYIESVPNGTLIQLNLGDRTYTHAISFLSFKRIELADKLVGIIVASKVWPDETWPTREHYQESAPYYKVLFERDIVLISERNIPSQVIQILKIGNI